MDYYYALLESYEQLKRRKFKLSLREAEGEEGGGGGPSYDKGEARTAIQDAGKATSQKEAQPVNNVKVWQKVGKADGAADSGAADSGAADSGAADSGGGITYYGGLPQGMVILMKDGQINPGDKESADKLISQLLGKTKDPDTDTTTPGDTPEDDTTQLPDPDQKELEVASIVSKKAEEIADTLGEISDHEEALQAVEDDEQTTDDKELTDEEKDKRLQQKEEDKEAEVDRLLDLNKNTMDFTGFNEETIAKTLQGVNDFLRLGLVMAEDPVGVNNGVYTDEINRLIADNNITTDQYGCIKFDGVGIGVCSDDGGDVEKKLQDWLALIQGAQRDDKEEKGVGSEARLVPPEDVDYDVAGDESRGVAVEDLDQLSNALDECLAATDSEARTACLDEFRRENLGSWERFEKWKEDMAVIVATLVCKGEDEFDKEGKRVCFATDNAKKKAIKKLGKQPGTDIDALTRSLAVGVLAEGSAILTGKEETRAYYRMKFIEDRLIAEGADPDAARQFVRDAAGIDEDGKYNPDNVDRMKVLLATVITNRHFAKAIRGDVTPTATRGAGQGQGGDASNEIGAKKDVVDVYCENDPKYAKMKGNLKKNIRENIKKNLLSDEQKAHYSKKCGEDIGGTDKEKDDRLNKFIDEDLIKEVDPSEFDPVVDCGDKGGGKAFSVNREPKTHIDLKQPSTMGEMSANKQKAVFDFMCKGNKGKLSKNEIKHLTKTADHIAECGGESGKKQMKGACDFHDKMKIRTENILKCLQPGAWVQDPKTGKALKIKPGQALLDMWFGRKKGKDGKPLKTALPGGEMYKRQEAAKRCLTGTGSVEDCEELDKVQRDVESADFGEMLREKKAPPKAHEYKYMDSKGNLKGEAKSYAMFMYSTIAGANGEVLNEKRGLADNQQRAGLRNAEVRANEAEADFIPGDGSTIYVVVMVDGKEPGSPKIPDQRAKLERESGVLKVKTGKSDTLYRTISDTQPAAEGGKARKKKEKLTQTVRRENVALTAANKKATDTKAKAKEAKAKAKKAKAKAKKDPTNTKLAAAEKKLAAAAKKLAAKEAQASTAAKNIATKNVAAAKKRADKKEAAEKKAAEKKRADKKKAAEKKKAPKKKASEKAEDVVMAFLKGQQDLLEKLIDQTT